MIGSIGVIFHQPPDLSDDMYRYGFENFWKVDLGGEGGKGGGKGKCAGNEILLKPIFYMCEQP